MSAKPIAVGDLVSVVRACCAYQRKRVVGQSSFVKKIFLSLTSCSGCGQLNDELHAVATNANRGGIPLPWLQRIDPPALPESTETREEISA